jgi:hypothetical protein
LEGVILKVNKKAMLINEKEIKYTYIENGSEAICFMFSGADYTYDKPLFYYSTMLMLENRLDVVHIQYSYKQDVLQLPLEQLTETIVKDVNAVIAEVLRNKEYKETILLGKSLGTIPMINEFMKNDVYANSKMILFTPLLKYDPIFETLLSGNHSTFLVIGKSDPHYISNKIEALSNKKNIKMKEIDNANHSLDIEPFNTLTSIIVLNEVMNSLNKFLNE